MSHAESDRERQKQLRCVEEAIEGLNSLMAHVEIKGKTKETKAMGRKLARKLLRITRDLGGLKDS